MVESSVAAAAALAAMCFCVQVLITSGVATTLASERDAGDRKFSDSSISSETVSPLCSGENVSLRVEASDEARKDLSGWLAKDTTRLVFIYFDLVVGNLTYHPGSCPNDGKTAIDAQTPLAWVLTSGGPEGGGDIGTHSFAHAYLTLPVSYPRIYSLGLLESHYVPRMRHEVYGMNVVVDNATAAVDGESCWNELNKTEKASLMLEVVQDFVRDLRVDRSDNKTSWSMCYTDPTNEDLPFSNSPLIPHTPAYVCQDGRGSMLTLERDSFLNGLFVLFICLSIGTLALQLYALSIGLRFFGSWGEKRALPKFPDGGRLFHHSTDTRFFNKSHIPVHATVGGLLRSDFVLGQQAFMRLKWVVFVGTVIFLYAVWPNLLVQSILIPTSSIASLGVSSSETFGYNLACRPNIPPGPSLSLVSTGFYCVCGPLFCCIYSLILLIRQPDLFTESSVYFVSFSKAPLRRLSAIFLTIVTYLRVILLLPSPVSRQKNARSFVWSPSGCCTLLWAFILAQFLFWIPLMAIIGFLVTLCLAGEVMEIMGFRTIYKNYALVEGVDYTGPIKFILTVILWLLFAPPIIVMYIEGSELLMFVMFSSVSLYITYPLPTFLVVSWSIALVAEAQNIIHDYRAPLLTIQESFTKKCFNLAKEHIQLAGGHSSSSLDEHSRLCLSDVSKSGQRLDWEKFFNQSEAVWDMVCLRLWVPFDESFLMKRSLDSVDEDEQVRSILKLLDVRPDSEIEEILRTKRVQRILWMRLFQGMVKLLLLVILFLTIITLLLAFNSLWAGPNPKDTNSLLLTILIVPMYTFVRTKLSTSSLTEKEQLLIDKSVDEGLDECFKNSVVEVSRCDWRWVQNLTERLDIGTQWRQATNTDVVCVCVCACMQVHVSDMFKMFRSSFTIRTPCRNYIRLYPLSQNGTHFRS